MNVSVFYSWQSDRPEDFCHYLIRDAANRALNDIGATNEVELLPRLDHDTKGEAGMPEIADTILRKIQRAGFFLADVTFVAETNKAKLIPNPNVLLELGFAARAIGWQRIICVMNEKYGERGQQIFNIRHRRLPIAYTLDDREQLATARSELATKIKNAFESLFWVEHNGVADTISKLDMYCLTFLKQHAHVNTINPPPTNRVTLGAPAGTLDTSGFTHAVTRLLDLDIIRCAVEKPSGRFVYEWTYLALLVLQRLGWRKTG
jgi:hypothetical protein